MGCEPDVEVWHRILQLRTLVMRPEEEPTLWIKFAHLCRENGRMGLAEKTVISLTQPIHTVSSYLLTLSHQIFMYVVEHKSRPSRFVFSLEIHLGERRSR